MKLTAIIITLLFALLMSACGKTPSDARALLEENPPPPELPSTSTTVISGAHGLMKISLSRPPDCLHAVQGLLAWKAPNGEQTIQILVGNGANSKIFAEGGNSGSAQTGSWIKPGTVFFMRLPGNTNAIDVITLPGRQCD